MNLRIACCCMVFAVILGGCVVHQEVYIQDATVTGPANNPPVAVTLDTTARQFRLSPRVGFFSPKALKGTIKDELGLNGGRPYALQWNLPDFTFGLGLDYSLSKSFSLAAGGEYSATGQISVWGGYAGIGLHSLAPGIGYRFDVGVMLSGLHHDARSVVVTNVGFLTGSSTDTAFYRDKGNDLGIDFYATLTLNSKFSDFPANVFLSGSIFRQTLMDYPPASPDQATVVVPIVSDVADAEYRATVFTLTPGVCVDLSGQVRLLAGWRFVFLSKTDLSPGTIGNPFLQLDFAP